MKVNQQLNLGWNLTLVPNETLISDDFNPNSIDEILSSPYDTVPAEVPGNFELDLFRAGKIADPFYSTNILGLQEFENRHLFYTLRFDAPQKPRGEQFLRFEGIDTIAKISLNGCFIGYTENMFLAREFPCPTLKEKDNELIVHIFPTCIQARNHRLTPAAFAQYYNYASLNIRKAAYMFGWDIMPRAVSGGIWKDVYLIEKQSERLEDTYLYVNSLDTDKRIAKLNLFYQIETDRDNIRPLKITVDGVCGQSTFHAAQELWHTAGNCRFTINDAVLWYPKNAGAPDLYHVTVRLWRDEEMIDERTFDFGVRTVELIRTSTIDADGNGDFHFRINGKKIFIMGTNWVPLDPYPSQNNKRMPRALELLDDIGVNMVRLWGGNVYEDEALFEFCDRHGILVWHDFAMGCAVYPQDELMQLKLREEATEIVRRTRQHACVALWAGDNEVDLAYSWNGLRRDPNTNVLTRTILPEVIRAEDPVRPYLPSSPYLDQFAYDSRGKTSEDHLWGPRDYFKSNFYKNATCALASETGYHGCPSPESLKKYIRPEQLYPITDDAGHTKEDWMVKASAMELREGAPYTYRIPLMTSQVQTMFGAIPDTLEQYAKLSQISQAEANKYFIERFRIGKWKRTGILWWNLLDGCPQISDAVVDYYFVKKLAYSYIKRAQAPVCMMMDESQDNVRRLVAVNDTPKDCQLHYTVRDVYTNESVSEGTAMAKADSAVTVAILPAPEDEDRFYLIEWDSEDGVIGKNHYMTKSRELCADRVLNAMTICGLDAFEGFS
jgi:beta-mannosidase